MRFALWIAVFSVLRTVMVYTERRTFSDEYCETSGPALYDVLDETDEETFELKIECLDNDDDDDDEEELAPEFDVDPL